MMNPAVPEGTFSRGFFKGAGSGALMMGIFTTVYAIAGLIPGSPVQFHLVASLATMAMGTLSTGLFSGVTATQRAAEAKSSASTVSHDASRVPVHAPERAVAPAMERAAHNSRAWTERVAQDHPKGHDRVSKILADGRLNDSDRAAAILREREQSSTLEASR